MSMWNIKPSSLLVGEVDLPGDKSISHRAILFGSLADGMTQVENLLEAEDVICTVNIMQKMGILIGKKGKTWWIKGNGLHGLQKPTEILYCGNSGTTLRLLTGLLAGAELEAKLTGDASLNKRPMGRVMQPLTAMGARIEEIKTDKGRVIHIQPKTLRGGVFKIPVASAQLKSALLFAGLTSGKKVEVTEPFKSRDHSELMLKAFGASIRVKGLTVTLLPTTTLKGQKIVVPGDFSSAAFFIVAALISRNPKTSLLIHNVGLNETRTGALDVLKKMGGKIKVLRQRIICGELVGDILVKPSRLKGVKISGKIIPRLIDEVPILSIAAAVAHGKTTIEDAGELRIKEADRIRALATELPRFGVEVKELKDGLEIFGRGDSQVLGAAGHSYGDHRMAMSLAVLGTVASGDTQISDTHCVGTSFPNFLNLMKKIGLKISSTA